MTHYSRRDFVKAGLAAGALASVGTAVASRARDGDRCGGAGKIRREGDAAGVWHGDDERPGAARSGADGVYKAGALCDEHGIRFYETAESYGDMHECWAWR